MKAQRNDLLPRRHRVMARATMIKRVMSATPNSDHVAVSYSIRGRGVGIGVVVTVTKQHINECLLQASTNNVMICADR